MLRMKPKDIAQLSEKIFKVVEGEEAAKVGMSLAAVLLILLQKYDITYTDVLGMADCMVFPEAKSFMITPEFEEIAKRM